MRYALLFVLLLFGGCVDRGYRAEEFFGSEVWAVMEKADKLECYLLEPAEPGYDGEVLKGGVKRASQAMDPGEEWLKVFALLEDPRAYDWDAKTECKPVPQALFRFWQGDKRVDLLLCLKCNLASLDWAGSRRMDNWVNISDARKNYLEILQKVFPQTARF